MTKTLFNEVISRDVKMVHIGLGAFHRAHQALYTSELNDQKESENWAIATVNLFGSLDLVNQLNQQKQQYAVLERGNEKDELKISNSIAYAYHPAEHGVETIVELMACEAIKIVSLTITEKGYCIEPSSGNLDLNNPLIQHDVSSPMRPQSAIGYIVAALKLRQLRHLSAFTVLSCDNIQQNGDVAKKAIISYARLIDAKLAQWIEDNVTFPNTMVDRIVPAVTAESLQSVEQALGYFDPCAVTCESFRQWVIEDNFVCGRPDWDKVGAQFVHDVRPFEKMKLRMLNGSHSFLAYLGYLSGYQYISEAMADPYFKAAIVDFMLNEQAQTLAMPDNIDVNQYADLLVERFENPKLQHQTAQIATDGSQKLPPRFCESIKCLRVKGQSTQWLELAVAGWMFYVTAQKSEFNDIIVNDPLAERYLSIKKQGLTPSERVKALFAIESIFDSEISQDKEFVEKVALRYESFLRHGVKETLYALVDETPLVDEKPLR
ncbi:mannitol dehydrogenase family protein [Vibrio aphrogenes]|uniref:mannitol dehydrogenase family protein n=1 Tax=Vibrio aphrogenes TaxID=1891186 RepID=UPI000B360E06|nr:fructuronate reductase [Vibrio aphrogenes]